MAKRSHDQRPGHVFLVGAGPGDPGLLTLRAVECLRLADLIVYDKLVPPRLLEYANPAAERRCMGDLPGGRQERWSQVMAEAIAAAGAGKTVVRLKGGDPLIFGRGLEEAGALREAGVPYEIVPGVTAALAAGACTEIPLTHRTAASAVAFVTGHEDPTKSGPGLDWAALARFPGTLSIYMGMGRLDRIAKTLVEHGRPADTPAAAVALAGTARQRSITAPLAKLAAAVSAAELTAPAVVLIGPAIGMKPRVCWFDSRPLFGKRVLVTRPRSQATELVRKLELLGATVIVRPAVQIVPPEDWAAVDDRLARLGDYDWLVFTSANGVHSFFGRLRQTGRDLRAMGGLKLAAVGPGTAEALRAFHLDVDLVPAEYRSESLAAALAEKAAGQKILLARADRGRDVLRTDLSKVATVDEVAVYRQADAELGMLSLADVDYITLTSSNIARSLLRSLDGLAQDRIRSGNVRLVTISPVTSGAVAEMGFPIAAEAREYTIDGLVEALIELAT